MATCTEYNREIELDGIPYDVVFEVVYHRTEGGPEPWEVGDFEVLEVNVLTVDGFLGNADLEYRLGREFDEDRFQEYIEC